MENRIRINVNNDITQNNYKKALFEQEKQRILIEKNEIQNKLKNELIKEVEKKPQPDPSKQMVRATIIDTDISNVSAGVRSDRLKSIKSADYLTMMKLLGVIVSQERDDIMFAPAYPGFLMESTTGESSVWIPEMQHGGSEDYTGVEVAENVFDKCITYSLDVKMPGSLSGKPFSRNAEIKPRVRETKLMDSVNKEKVVTVFGQWFDLLINFDCFAKTNDEVDLLVKWLEELLHEECGFLMSMGASKITYWDRVSPPPIPGIKTDIPRRRVRYYIREEVTYINRERTIQEIQVILEKLNKII